MTCPNCNRPFHAALPNARLCRTCWFERQGDYDRALAEIAWGRGYVLAPPRALLGLGGGTAGDGGGDDDGAA